jgi:hypothetical protein
MGKWKLTNALACTRKQFENAKQSRNIQVIWWKAIRKKR